MRSWFLTFLHSDPPAGGGGDAAQQPQRQDGGSTTGFDADRATRSMIAEARGNVKAVIKHLIKEGHRYRERIRQLDTELRERPAKLEAGAVILKPTEGKVWTVVQGLIGGMQDPEKELPQRLQRGAELEAAETDRQWAARVTAAATGAGIKRPTLLVDQLRQRGQDVIEKDVTLVEAGKQTTKKVPHVRKAGAADTEPTKPLAQYVDEDLKDYKELLFTEPGDTRPADTRQPQQGEPRYPAQGGTRGRAPNNDLVAQHGQRYASPAELQQRQQQQGA